MRPSQTANAVIKPAAITTARQQSPATMPDTMINLELRSTGIRQPGLDVIAKFLLHPLRPFLMADASENTNQILRERPLESMRISIKAIKKQLNTSGHKLKFDVIPQYQLETRRNFMQIKRLYII